MGVKRFGIANQTPFQHAKDSKRITLRMKFQLEMNEGARLSVEVATCLSRRGSKTSLFIQRESSWIDLKKVEIGNEKKAKSYGRTISCCTSAGTAAREMTLEIVEAWPRSRQMQAYF